MLNFHLCSHLGKVVIEKKSINCLFYFWMWLLICFSMFIFRNRLSIWEIFEDWNLFWWYDKSRSWCGPKNRRNIPYYWRCYEGPYQLWSCYWRNVKWGTFGKRSSGTYLQNKHTILRSSLVQWDHVCASNFTFHNGTKLWMHF